MRNWLKCASLKPSSRRSTARCGCFEPPSPGKPPRAANARVSWASKPVSASTPTSTSTTRTRPRERARSSLPLRHCCGPCPPPQRPRRETYSARRRRSWSRRPFSRPKARRPASASRGARGTTGARKAPNHRYTREAWRNAPPTTGARQSGSGSLTHTGRPKTVTLATSSTPGGRATRRRGRRQATTPGGVGAMTAGRTAHRRRSPREPACSAGRSALRASPSASASPRRSTDTTGRLTPAYGSMTTAWHASRAEPPPTRSSSVTCPCTSPTRRGRGLNICRPARSTTGMIWSAPSWGTSRARTCALVTPGTCAHAPRSPASRFGTSYDTFPRAARSSRAWPSPKIVHSFLEGTTCRDLARTRTQPARRLERAVRHRHQLRFWRRSGGGDLRREERQARGRARGGQQVQRTSSRSTSGARKGRSHTARRASRGVMTTATKPLLLTQLDGTLELPLEALGYSMTC
jgi:hypothetical protein